MTIKLGYKPELWMKNWPSPKPQTGRFGSQVKWYPWWISDKNMLNKIQKTTSYKNKLTPYTIQFKYYSIY